MRHAILIMAHKDIEFLCRVVEYFDQCCDVFIHLDRKMQVESKDLDVLRGYEQVKCVSRKYEVNWGGTSVLDCELYLLNMAMSHSDADYFHLLSGQDYPVLPLQDFLDFFTQNAGKEYLQYVRLPHPRWEDSTYWRFQYYYPYDSASDKKNPRRWVRDQVKLQHDKGMKRPIPDEFDHLYGSSQWFSITRKAVSALLNYTRQSPSLYQQFWMTFAPEETYVATVLVNLLGKENIVPYNLRFIYWKYENGNRPANLGKEHFRFLLEKKYFFARKMEQPYCKGLLPLIDQYLLNDEEISQGVTGAWIYNGLRKYHYDEKFCNVVTQFCQEIGVAAALDMGCGSGFYVSQWRSRKLPFAGYDANPHTPALSQMLLPEGDTLCGVADLTEELQIPHSFDFVVCKDVLPYIPAELEDMAVKNLSLLSSHFILLSWDGTASIKNVDCRMIDEQDLLSKFEKQDFLPEKYMTKRLRIILKRNNCCLLIKRGLQIIDNF